MLWLAACMLLTIAIFYSLIGHSREQVSKLVVSIAGDGSRLSLREHMKLAEASWAKTVKQRHDMIQADYGTVDKLPL